MPQKLDENVRQFLVDLTALTKKYGLAIGGCGCCGSPWLEPIDVSNEKSGYIYDDLEVKFIEQSGPWWNDKNSHIIRDEETI